MATKNRHMFELRLGKLGLILFVCGMSILLFSMFLLGIVLGKHMEAYPERFSPGIAEMIRSAVTSSASKLDKPKSSVEAAKTDVPAGGEESFDLTFYDVLGGKKGEPRSAKPGRWKDQSASDTAFPVTASTGKIELKEPDSGAAGSLVGDAVPSTSGAAVKKTLLTEKKTAEESTARISETAPAKKLAESGASAAKGHYEIQVAALQDKKKAEGLAQKLRALGFAPRVVEKDLPGKGRWYRLIVGGFETREKAKAAADRLDSKIHGVKSVIRSSGKK